MTEPEATNSPPAAVPQPPLRQSWTLSGYPIVDNYRDLAAGRIAQVEASEEFAPRPPALEVYWHNRMQTDRTDLFGGLVTGANVDVTEYLRRVGRFLDANSCEVLALNATKYAVNIILAVDCSCQEMRTWLTEHDLLHAR